MHSATNPRLIPRFTRFLTPAYNFLYAITFLRENPQDNAIKKFKTAIQPLLLVPSGRHPIGTMRPPIHESHPEHVKGLFHQSKLPEIKRFE